MGEGDTGDTGDTTGGFGGSQGFSSDPGSIDSSLGGWGTGADPGWGSGMSDMFDPNALGFDTGFESGEFGPSNQGFESSEYSPQEEETGWSKFAKNWQQFTKSPIGVVANIAASLNPVTRGLMSLGNLSTGLTTNPGQTAASTIGGIAGNAMGMPSVPGVGNLGGVAAGMAYGGMTGGQAAPSGPSPGSTGTGGTDWAGLGGTLAGLYGLNRMRTGANDMVSNLGGMFSEGSPYATMLRQQLNRRDAAAGRRSQYGPREVELQAKLAGMANQIAPNIMAGRNQSLQSLMQMLYLGGQGYQHGVFRGLGNMFSTPNPSVSQSDVSNWGTDTGAFPGGDWGG